MSYENMFGLDELSVEKNRIIGLLEREREMLIEGGMTPETREAVIQWTEQMEQRSLISAIEMLRFNVERAELYEAMEK